MNRRLLFEKMLLGINNGTGKTVSFEYREYFVSNFIEHFYCDNVYQKHKHMYYIEFESENSVVPAFMQISSKNEWLEIKNHLPIKTKVNVVGKDVYLDDDLTFSNIISFSIGDMTVSKENIRDFLTQGISQRKKKTNTCLLVGYPIAILILTKFNNLFVFALIPEIVVIIYIANFLNKKAAKKIATDFEKHGFHSIRQQSIVATESENATLLNPSCKYSEYIIYNEK